MGERDLRRDAVKELYIGPGFFPTIVNASYNVRWSHAGDSLNPLKNNGLLAWNEVCVAEAQAWGKHRSGFIWRI